MSVVGKTSAVFMGDGSLLIQCADLFLERGHTICAVITSSPQIFEWAQKVNLTTIDAADNLTAKVGDLQFNWFFSAANLKIIPDAVWQRASNGAANFHDGPLPQHAGLNAPSWALLAGDVSYGVTWHALTSGIDDGDIYTQSLFEIEPDDTSLTLNTKCLEAGIETFSQLVDGIETVAMKGQPQNRMQRSYHRRLDRPSRAATLDFSQPSATLDRLSRALSFGAGYLNPLGLPKIWCGQRSYNVGAMTIAATTENQMSPGTIAAVDQYNAVVACADGSVQISMLTDEVGHHITPSQLFRIGDILAPLPLAIATAVDEQSQMIARSEAFFAHRLARFRTIDLQGARDIDPARRAQWSTIALTTPPNINAARIIVGLAAGIARLTDQTDAHLFFSSDHLEEHAQAQPGYIADTQPFCVSFDDGCTARDAVDLVERELADLDRRIGFAADLVSRRPGLVYPSSTIGIRLTGSPELAAPISNTAMTFIVSANGLQCRALIDGSRIAEREAHAIIEQLSTAVAWFAEPTDLLVADVPLMSPLDELALIATRNATAVSYDRTALVHGLFEAQAIRTPDAVAIICGGETLSYRALDEKANAVARCLIAYGVGPDVLVGLHLARSCNLVVGALAILKAGGAYVPLDPTYPADRIAMMIEDSELQLVIADDDIPFRDHRTGLRLLTIDAAVGRNAPVTSAKPAITSSNLAYVIYTSGSTGRPKGVMIEHRNVVNFCSGMDQRVPRNQDDQPVWLAVTSLSFDISVLELFWTLARGFKVIIAREARPTAMPSGTAGLVSSAARMLDFSLFYWGDDDTAGADKYRLLLDGARFADAHGFKAIWTPERHFHAFGGPYPNSSVTGAAVAAITRNVQIRAGSCVLPLHHPARVAEEWAVIDNISQGRAAVAFASGWMPEDFLLRPENAPPNNKAALLRDIDIVRRLWRGEKVVFDAPNGKQVAITTLPRPIQPELPVWMTTAGNADTFREAGRLGVNILTHLLGQSIGDVGEKIRIYREALAQSGHDPQRFTVTLMLHTLIGQDRGSVRSTARGPMMRYLRSAAALIKDYAWAFPAFKRPVGVNRPFELDLQSLAPEEMDAIVDFAFQRYFDDSGLFGTVEDATARAAQLAAIGVNEIACLIDFGVPTDTALSGLEPLARVISAMRTEPTVQQGSELDETIGSLIRTHGVTHFQCTPAMATLLLGTDENRTALSTLKHTFLGGEALSTSLAAEWLAATGATLENMYGPTETTIWSSTGPALDGGGTIPLGTPIANTQLYVLDSKMRPVPQGAAGELFIGGDGVARGYYRREDLTRERFLPNPFSEGSRIYRTGDVVRIGTDGHLYYLGRGDHQVKVRGHRIELGEIEACLGTHDGVAQAVVVAREDVKGDIRIAAYVRFRSVRIADEQLKAHARLTLPEFMVPAHFVAIEQFPLTPNAKIDRKALPRPLDGAASMPAIAYAAPDSTISRQIADVFKQTLGVERVGLNDNFFDLGGHSLLAVQAHRRLKAEIAPTLSITDIYRFPTIAGLIGHLQAKDQPNARLDSAAARAASRRNARSGRKPSPAAVN
jgi:natural product biosynthesis luciferase-like monooxygenase protein